MPYIIRKKIEGTDNNPLMLQLNIDDERIAKYYELDTGIETYLRSTLTILVDENCCVKRVINKPFDFRVVSKGWYTGNGNDVTYLRRLLLPPNFVRDYAIKANMGLELEIDELVYKSFQGTSPPQLCSEANKIFSEERVEGSKDFEIKGTSGEPLHNSELLIDTMFNDKFYDDLKFEINTAFRVGLYTATMVLVRKLFERLIIDLLRQKYGMARKELFYSDGFLNLSTLIRNLRDKLDDFKPYDFFKLEKEKESFVNFLFDVKEEGNAGAHSIEPCLDYNEIKELKPSINKYSDLLVRMYRKVKEIPN
jgi:hypothetical protein